MITIRESIQDIIVTTPYLEEALGKGIINLSALARIIRPEIKKRLYKLDVSDAALIMALKRLQPEIRRKNTIPKIFKDMDDITVRSDLVELTVHNSSEIEKMKRELMKVVADEKSFFFNLIQGAKESTILINRHLEQKVHKFLNGKGKLLSRIDKLSSITFALPPSNRKTPGVYYMILKTLAWENINLVEIMSNHNEVTLVFDESDIDRAFSLIKNLKD